MMKVFTMFSAFLFLGALSFAQTNKVASIEVADHSGEKNNIFKTYYWKNSWADMPFLPKIEAITNKNHFTIHFSSKEKVLYPYIKNESIKIGASTILYSYPIFPGDAVKVTINKNKELTFSGTGSEKYSLIYKIRYKLQLAKKALQDSIRLRHRKMGIVRPLMDYNYYMNSMKASLDQLSLCKRIIDQALVESTASLSTFTLKLIKANLIGELENESIQIYRSCYLKIKRNPNLNSETNIQELTRVYTSRAKFNFSTLGDEILSCSDGFLNFEINYMNNEDLVLDNAFNYAVNNFSGELRDKLLTGFIASNFYHSNLKTDILNDAIRVVKLKYCREILLSLNEASIPGKEAYNFNLSDTAGNIISKSDLKGKVIVMDFYFTGCSGCRTLNEKMSNIISKYGVREDIVFVAVSIDKDVSIWKTSVQSNLYSHKGSINLYTNGLGSAHPMIKHYKIGSYPTVILIDKKGKVLSANPPRPYNLADEKKLEQILDSAILAN